VTLDDPFDDSQTNASPLEFLVRMQSFKDAEKLVNEAHIKPGAIILDSVDGLLPFHDSVHFDNGFWPSRRELYSVANKISQYLTDHGLITVDAREIAYTQANVARGDSLIQFSEHIPHQSAHIYGLHLETQARRAREREKIVDELTHPLGVFDHKPQEALPLLIDFLLIVLKHDARIAVDGPQWRPQIVGDGIGERFQLLVSVLQFFVGLLQQRRALRHPDLKFGIEPERLVLSLFAFSDVVIEHDQTIDRTGFVSHGQQDGVEISRVRAKFAALLVRNGLAGFGALAKQLQ